MQERNDQSQISMQIDLRKNTNHNEYYNLKFKKKKKLAGIIQCNSDDTNESFESKIWVDSLEMNSWNWFTEMNQIYNVFATQV